MTTLREAAQQALEALESGLLIPHSAEVFANLRAALAENDKRMEWYRKRKANWDLQRKLASETKERDRQWREYEEERLAALEEPTVPSDCAADSHQQATELSRLHAELERCKQVCAATAEGWRVDAALAELVQEPVAKVELMTAGGNAGLATRIVEIDDHLRERLRPGQMLYTAPPQRKPLTEEAIDQITRDRWGTQLLGVMVQAHREYARAIERAHGIGEQP